MLQILGGAILQISAEGSMRHHGECQGELREHSLVLNRTLLIGDFLIFPQIHSAAWLTALVIILSACWQQAASLPRPAAYKDNSVKGYLAEVCKFNILNFGCT
jgi:hypothetical protein